MCGIIGVIGNGVKEHIINGLLNMEYRGYDSCGVAFIKENQLFVQKSLVSPREFYDIVADFRIGIGHTRWATHGTVSLVNAHPVLSSFHNLAMVHNGIIENYKEIKERLINNNISFTTETDTEVLINLIAYYYERMSLESAIEMSLKQIKGSYAFLLIDPQSPNKIFYACYNMPLIIGKGIDELVIASDILAFPKAVSECVYLNSHSKGYICTDNLDGWKFQPIKWDNNIFSLKAEENYMLKEIKEESKIISKLFDKYKSKDNGLFKRLFGIINNAENICMIGCGSSYNAILVGAHLFEQHMNKKVKTYYASEFIYDNCNHDFDCYILVSQSGETADILKALQKVDADKIIAVTNVMTSTLARKTKNIIDMCAGYEISVASTKAYLATIYIFYLLAHPLIDAYNTKLIVNSIQKVVNNNLEVKKFASSFIKSHFFIFIGRGLDYSINLENTLKIKEITYSNVDNYCAGELKHGPLALCDESTVVFAINSSASTNLIMRSNLEEVKSRGSKCYCFSSNQNFIDNDTYRLDLSEELTIFEVVVFFQIFAYYLSTLRNINPDRPKNLAKSVTVE